MGSSQKSTTTSRNRPAPTADRSRLGILRRRVRHTAALVHIPWKRIGAAAAALVGLGFFLHHPQSRTARVTDANRPATRAENSVGHAASASLPSPITPSKQTAAPARVRPVAAAVAVPRIASAVVHKSTAPSRKHGAPAHKKNGKHGKNKKHGKGKKKHG